MTRLVHFCSVICLKKCLVFVHKDVGTLWLLQHWFQWKNQKQVEMPINTGMAGKQRDIPNIKCIAIVKRMRWRCMPRQIQLSKTLICEQNKLQNHTGNLIPWNDSTCISIDSIYSSIDFNIYFSICVYNSWNIYTVISYVHIYMN